MQCRFSFIHSFARSFVGSFFFLWTLRSRYYVGNLRTHWIALIPRQAAISDKKFSGNRPQSLRSFSFSLSLRRCPLPRVSLIHFLFYFLGMFVRMLCNIEIPCRYSGSRRSLAKHEQCIQNMQCRCNRSGRNAFSMSTKENKITNAP